MIASAAWALSAACAHDHPPSHAVHWPPRQFAHAFTALEPLRRSSKLSCRPRAEQLSSPQATDEPLFSRPPPPNDPNNALPVIPPPTLMQQRLDTLLHLLGRRRSVEEDDLLDSAFCWRKGLASCSIAGGRSGRVGSRGNDDPQHCRAARTALGTLTARVLPLRAKRASRTACFVRLAASRVS